MQLTAAFFLFLLFFLKLLLLRYWESGMGWTTRRQGGRKRWSRSRSRRSCDRSIQFFTDHPKWKKRSLPFIPNPVVHFFCYWRAGGAGVQDNTLRFVFALHRFKVWWNFFSFCLWPRLCAAFRSRAYTILQPVKYPSEKSFHPFSVRKKFPPISSIPLAPELWANDVCVKQNLENMDFGPMAK